VPVIVSPRSIGIVALIVLAAGLAGWMFGASGRSEVEQARRAAEHRADLNEARALVLEGNIAVFQLNFGDASKRFESARAAIERIQTALRETGQAERAGRLEVALSHLRDAQRLAVSLDGNARTAADAALQALASSQS
jgi:hypothetical protein